MSNTFDSFYILPSIFHTDLDRGFSVIDYNLNKTYGSIDDINELKKLKIDLKLDFILNHASVLSKQFQDIITNGKESIYKDFFIDWNKFWDGYGTMTDEGYVKPDAKYIQNMYFRKPGLPILKVRMPDGTEVPYWNTFYQEVKYDKMDAQDIMRCMDIQYTSAESLASIVYQSLQEGIALKEIDFKQYNKYRDPMIALLESRRKYLGQMDVNIESPLVWEFYEDTLKKLSAYGAKIVRLDAFAYVSKVPGEKNFFNKPQTWKILAQLRELADKYHVTLLPEIHASYEEGIHKQIAKEGYRIYDFFLPGLIIDAFERNTSKVLVQWIREILDNNIHTVNMLGCHDGIPLLDLKGLLTEEQIKNLIDVVVKRGGYVKDLHGKENIYYQVNATYYSALGEDSKKLLLARAIQIFMPGKPQVWYLDLFAGTNDYEAVKKAGPAGHKEINRTNLSLNHVIEKLKDEVVLEQLKLLQFRNINPAFHVNSQVNVYDTADDILKIKWEYEGKKAILEADLKQYTYNITT
jgi:sucrose phosphorylase